MNSDNRCLGTGPASFASKGLKGTVVAGRWNPSPWRSLLGVGEMRATIGMLLGLGLTCAANAGISLYGDGEGYDSHDKDWLSNTVDDIDGNGLGTDGYIFFGNFDGSGGNQTYGGVGSDITAIAADKITDVLPTYVSEASIGADCNNKIGSFSHYEALDDPLIGDGTDGVCGNIIVIAPGNGEALDFSIDGLSAGAIVRVGVVTVLNDGSADARWDIPTIALTDGSETVSVTDLPNLSDPNDTSGPGWVFFDIDSDGDYTILLPPDAAGVDPDHTGFGGVTFDSFQVGDGAALLFAPGALSLEIDAPETSASGIVGASYHGGLATSNDIEILSLAVDSGFAASAADPTLGIGDSSEDIVVSFDNSAGSLAGGESAISTLVVTWSETGSGVSHTTHIPVKVTNNDPIVGYVDTDVAEEEWYFFDYDGGSTFSSPTPAGYTVDVADGSQDQIFPAEIQQFATGFDMSKIGQKITAEFDVVMNVATASFDKDFRFGFFDTSKNVQIISMNDLGPVSGSSMSTKVGKEISYNNGDGGVFVTNDYATLCILYGSAFDSDSGAIPEGNGLIQGVTNHFSFSIERVGEDELFIQTDWSDGGNSASSSATLDETTTTAGVAEYLPSGGYESFDGFGLQIHEQFSGADYTLSNFRLTYAIPLRASFDFGVSSITLESSGDVTLTLTDPIFGASYLVRASDDLEGWDDVGSYVVSVPGVITLPAADISAFVGDKGFFQVELQSIPAE